MKKAILTMILMTSVHAMATGGSDVGSAICTISRTKNPANHIQVYGEIVAVGQVNRGDNSNNTFIIRPDGKSMRTRYNDFDKAREFLNGGEGTFVTVIAAEGTPSVHEVLIGTFHPGETFPSFDLQASSYDGPVSLMDKANGINVGCLTPETP